MTENHACGRCIASGDPDLCFPDTAVDVSIAVAKFPTEEESRRLLQGLYGLNSEFVTEERVRRQMAVGTTIIEDTTACERWLQTCEFCDDPYVMPNPDLDAHGMDNSYTGRWISHERQDRVCRNCAGEVLVCAMCDTIVRWDCGYGYRHNLYVCEGCRDYECTYCDDCDTYWPNDDGCHHLDARSSNGMEVHNYSFKPRPLWQYVESVDGDLSYANVRQRVPFMGMELEVESMGNPFRDALDVVEAAFGERAYCKHDGSLDSGFEIVTHPMTLAAYKEYVDWNFCSRMTGLGWRSWQPGTCGLHVHISRSSFQSLTHLALFQFLILHNRSAMQWLAGRDGSHWARFEGVSKNVIPAMKGKRDYYRERYEAINVTNASTIEIRMFRGSLRRDRVLMALELVHACWAYTSGLGSNAYINGACSMMRFAEWAYGKEEYEHLNKYLEKMPERRLLGV